MEIRGQQVLITGANRGIGRGIAKMCAESGAHLHLAIRREDPEFTKELKTAGAASVKIWNCDLGSREGTAKLLQALTGQEIDILINNAGLLTGGLIENQPLDEIYSMFQVNLLSLVQLTRGILPGMLERNRGKIVNNASIMAHLHVPCASTYAASKSAVVAFTDCIRGELQGTGVSALCLITPGIKTQLYDDIDKKYGKHIEAPASAGALSPKQYAEMVREAILLDLDELLPRGLASVGLKAAKYMPALFQYLVQRRFSRAPKA